jgi:hypothetical protein
MPIPNIAAWQRGAVFIIFLVSCHMHAVPSRWTQDAYYVTASSGRNEEPLYEKVLPPGTAAFHYAYIIRHVVYMQGRTAMKQAGCKSVTMERRSR